MCEIICFTSMKYIPFDFSMLEFKLSHDDCWTALSEELPVKIHTVIAKPQRQRDRILGLIEVKVDTNVAFGRFIRRFGREPSIRKVVSVTNVGGSRHHFKVLFLEKYDQMLMGLLDEYTVLYENDATSNGFETLSLMVPSDEVQSLKQDLSNLGKVVDFKSRSVDEERYLKFNLSLSESEIKVLKIAYSKGYYELPKRTYLGGISEAATLSKSTVEEHLRKAENKIICSEVVRY